MRTIVAAGLAAGVLIACEQQQTSAPKFTSADFRSLPKATDGADGSGCLAYAAFAALRGTETTGRPLGNADFIAGLERLLGRPIARRAPGRKPLDLSTDQSSLL